MLAYELSNIFKVIIFLYHMTTFGLWAAYNAGVKKKKKNESPCTPGLKKKIKVFLISI